MPNIVGEAPFQIRSGKTEVTRFYAILASSVIVIVIGVTLGLELFWRKDTGDCTGGQVAGGAVGGSFELQGGNGQTVTDRDIIDRPTLVYFGYTFCPDVCPFDVARNAVAVDLLSERGIEVRPVFISVDPERDTPDVVSEFAEAYHPDMIGLTGTQEQVKAVSKAYRVYFKLRNGGGDSHYLVDHSTFTYLMFPGNVFADFFRRDVVPEDMASRVACFVESA
ncbi:MAG: SCO family protein [Rhodobacteraceae bacterium]|nr:SCO family protein [Paracoccaceae bacterium]